MNLSSLQIGLLVGLSGFLLWKHWLRVLAQRRANAARPRGHGFEASELKARLGNWRERYPEISSHRRRPTAAHEAFAAALRKSLLRLPFFQSLHESEPSASDHSSPKRVS